MRRFNSFNKIRIKLASPEQILSWSYGEVKKPETINYRSLRPERDGLFCEKIFGTTKEWECQCGKFKSIRYKGVVCDRCGVEVSHFKVRRERMGHIQLATPIAHIWYYKSVPSRLGLIINLTMSELESVIYYENYIVIDVGETDLEEKQLLTETEYLEYRRQHGINFTAEMGATALQMLLQKINLEAEEKELRMKMNEKGERSDTKLLKRIELIKDFKNSGNRCDWMIIDIVPVIPPELRPMIQLDNGRFATSDLNDLYRRIINRNNRLKRLLTLRAPDIIIRNEKRMLQEAVDSLFDNSKRKRMIRGPGNRPLKSIADMLKGKQGRFRQNLLGKRVDYSGRSVIVVGPRLKLHQCGLPKSMALELFKPFVMRGLVQKEIVYNIKSAKKMIDKEEPSVWAILEEVIRAHPVLLNRAPTLHRLGIQAFEPILVEGSAIQLHPLVCHAFNADFDGDQMAVHVPLSVEAQIESWLLMLASNNLLNPANGEPIVTPTLDIVLGIYSLTKARNGVEGEGKYFSSSEEVLIALENKLIDVQAKINVVLDSSNNVFTLTTPGRIVFNAILPKTLEFINENLTDKMISRIILKVFHQCGHYDTVILVDKIKDLGFEYATLFGISIGLTDIKIPSRKEKLITDGDAKVKKIVQNYQSGYLTEDERYNQVVDVWTRVSDSISDDMMKELAEDQDGFNPLFIMAESGARGSKQQIRQLAGMRGLMAKPSGEILELPIKSNFKEGLTVLEYFISTHGARKGLADTAIKTADAGYLTRRLVDIAQDVVITTPNCGSLNGIDQYLVKEDQDSEVLLEQLRGRYSLEDVYHPMTGEKIINANEEVDKNIARKLRSAGVEKIKVRAVITCELRHGLCIKCYGRNLATGKMVEIGEAVGIIAAQSIGQPGTQLTMRTFHIGGTAARQLEEQEIRLNTPILVAKLPDNVLFLDDGRVVTSRKGELIYHRVLDSYDRKQFKSLTVEDEVSVLIGELIGVNLQGEQVFFRYGGIVKFLTNDDSDQIYLLGDLRHLPVKSGTRLFVRKENEVIPKQEVIAEFDPYNEPLLSEAAGRIKFKDIIIGSTLKLERGEGNSIRERVIVEIRDGSLVPKIGVIDDEGKEIFDIAIPGGTYLLVDEGERVQIGSIIAKIIRAQTKTKDITGGLPRIAELFEARKPKDSCVIAECDGIVRFGDKQKGKTSINVEYDDYDEHGNKVLQHKKHVIHSGKRILVFDGDYIKAGEQLCDGPINPHDILKVESVERLQEYLIAEIQGVYRLQGVHISDKHVGIIIRQMLRKVEIIEPGDTDFIIGQQVDKFVFHDVNHNIVKEGGKAAVAKPILQGITKASLNINSFISAASFQETTKVLTTAAIRGSQDPLRGLKENVIIGHLIPAGTGMKKKKLDTTTD